jgi:hypothetical protein
LRNRIGDGLGWVVRSRKHLQRSQRTIGDPQTIGEGTARIDGNAQRNLR